MKLSRIGVVVRVVLATSALWAGTLWAGNTAGSSSPDAALTSKLKAITVDLTFSNAPLEEVATYLATQSRTLDPEKKGVNIVVKPGDVSAWPKMTFSLKNISMYDALCVAAKMSDSTLEFESGVVFLKRP